MINRISHSMNLGRREINNFLSGDEMNDTNVQREIQPSVTMIPSLWWRNMSCLLQGNIWRD